MPRPTTDKDPTQRSTAVRTATDLVKLIENTLGWVPEPTESKPLWKCYSIEAGKINKAIKKNPRLLTMPNLVHTVEWLAANKTEVRSPIGVTYFVERALKDRPQEGDHRPGQPRPTTDIAERITSALATTISRNKPGAQEWIDRLTRAQGSQREDVYREWLDWNGSHE